jgi:hypothetical protein
MCGGACLVLASLQACGSVPRHGRRTGALHSTAVTPEAPTSRGINFFYVKEMRCYAPRKITTLNPFRAVCGKRA